METDAKKILETLPSFDVLLSVIEEIKQLSLKKMILEKEIKTLESQTFTIVMTDDKYFVGGKPVAVSYFENCFKYTGIGGMILEKRTELSVVTSDLDSKRAEYDVYKQMHDFWKTLVYMEKSGY
jgi:hypothetical protein